MPYRYDLVFTSRGDHAMMPSPNGGWIHWRDADKNGVAFEPIAISDRLPRDSECELDEFCVLWCWALRKRHSTFSPYFWQKADIKELRISPDLFSHWLPSKAILIPLPDVAPPTKPQPTGGRLIKEPRP